LCEKRPKYQKRQHKVILLHNNAPSHTAKLGNNWGIWLGNTFVCGLLTRLGSVRLPLICIDGTRTCLAALHFFRRCTKIARWLVWLKRTTIFLAWHPQIVKQMEKIYSYRWAILRIKYFLSFSCNKRVFSIKKFRFHIYIHIYIPYIYISLM